MNSNNQPARLGDPQWLYLIFESQGDIFASISELILDENMELILDRKSQFPEEYSEFMLNMKLYESAIKHFESSFSKVQHSADDMRAYLIDNNPYFLRMDSTGYAGLRQAYESDPFFKTRLRAYQKNFRDALNNFKNIRSLHATTLAEIEILKGNTDLDNLFQNLSFKPQPRFDCDTLIVDASIFAKPRIMIEIDNFPIYNKASDTLIVKIVGPGGNALGETQLPPKVFRWFDQPTGMVFKFYHKDRCIVQTRAIRNSYIILDP